MADDSDGSGGRNLALGLQIAVGVGLGAVVGNWIDHKYRTDPWGVIIGTVLGFASGMYLLIKDAMSSNKN